MKKVLFIGVILFISFFLSAQNPEKGVRFIDNEPWENVLQKTKEQNRWVFVDCYTSWCGPCKWLAKDILTREKIGAFVNEHFVSVKYDVEKGAGLDFARRYGQYIKGYPTMLAIKADGNVVQRIIGALPEEEIIQALQAGLQGTTWQGLETEYRAGNRECDFLIDYLNLLATSGEKEKAQAVADDFFNHVPLDSLLNPKVWNTIGKYVESPESEPYRYVIQNIHVFADKGFDRHELEWKLALHAYSRISDIIKTGFQTENRDSLDGLRKGLLVLDTVLRYPIKNFPEYLACVRTEISYLERNTEELFYRFIYLGENDLLRSWDWEKAWAEYLINHLSDKKQLKRCIEYLHRIQKQEEKGENKLFVRSCYDILAQGYRRLKDKAKAEACLRADKELQKKQEDTMKAFKF